MPERVTALLELESGLNETISVFMTVLLVQCLTTPGGITTGHAVGVLLKEMLGVQPQDLQQALRCSGSYAVLPGEASIYPVLALTRVLAVFGGVQTLGASGFLAVYAVHIAACSRFVNTPHYYSTLHP